MSTFDGDLRELYTDEDLSPTTAVYIHCPMHVDKRRPSMRVYAEGAKCFTCGAYLSRRALLEKAEPDRITAAKLHSSGRSQKVARPELRVEEIRVLARIAAEVSTPDELSYFENRGLTPETVGRYWLGHYGFGYTIPVFSSDGGMVNDIVTVKFRRDEYLAYDDTPKYWGLRGHNEPRVYPWPVPAEEKHIILVEGEFDCLILRQAGLSAYTLTSGAASWNKINQTTFPTHTHITLLYDSDEAGLEAEGHLLEHLPKMGYGADSLGLPPGVKDISELAVEHPDQFNEFVHLLKEELGRKLWTPQTQQRIPPSVASPL